jgi:hypothetical protein
MKKHVILFLAANPRGSNALTLGEECAEIQRELKMTRHRDDFHFESRWAVSIDELMRHLTELDPTVIHFSGHGGGSAGLMLQDEQGQPQPVSARALAMMVDAAARNARVVVLNACYSTVQAEALRAKVDCIVGMDGAIGDAAARAFAIRFYGALGNRRSIGNAVEHGIAALAAKQLPEEVLPRCLTRDGIDADKVLLDLWSRSSPVKPAGIGRQPLASASAAGSVPPHTPDRTLDPRGSGAARAFGSGIRRDRRAVLHVRRRPPDVRHRFQPGFEVTTRVQELLRDMHVRLLAGYAADAVSRAAAIAEVALKALAGKPPEASATLGELIGERRRSGKTELLADASWLDQRQVVAKQFAGQVRAELDDDGRRACEIAVRFAVAAGLVTEAESTGCQRSAEWQASEPASSALLRLDRAMHRKALDDLLELPRRVLVFLVHGEVDQGHDHFAEIMTWRLRSGPSGRWREVVVNWPPPSASLGTRLAILFEELANALGIKLTLPAGDPATPDGARTWLPALAPVLAAIDARRERLLVRHVLRWLGTGAGGDDALVDAYVRAIWARVALRPGERVVVGLDLRRIERGGMLLTKAWRTSRAELAAARSIEIVLDRLDMPHGGVCLTLPELTSVPVSDLVDWLRRDGGRNRDVAQVEANQLVSSTRGGRFDLVVQRLTALNLDRRRNTK